MAERFYDEERDDYESRELIWDLRADEIEADRDAGLYGSDDEWDHDWNEYVFLQQMPAAERTSYSNFLRDRFRRARVQRQAPLGWK